MGLISKSVAQPSTSFGHVQTLTVTTCMAVKVFIEHCQCRPVALNGTSATPV